MQTACRIIAAALVAGYLAGGCANDKPEPAGPIVPTGPVVIGDYTISTLHLGWRLLAVAVDSDTHTAVVTDREQDGKDTVFLVDTSTRSITATIPGHKTDRIAIDAVNHIAYVNSYEGLLLVDTNSRATVGSIEVPGNTLDVAVDPDTHTAFVAINVVGLGVVDLAARKFRWAVGPGPGSASNDTAVAADPVSHSVYMTTGVDLWIFGAPKPTKPDGQVFIDLGPAPVAVDPTTHLIYAAGEKDGVGRLAVVDPATRAVTATVPMGRKPSSIAVDPTDHTVYVTDYNDGTLSVVDATTNTVKATVPVGRKPLGVAVDPANHTIYVTSYEDGTLSIITRR
ncbi:YncE family protein [Nocardia sp. NPDC004604]|uniref:YncE family protein n=1 Tax=Nocardia sp. NPDC004604 TaxID=3157013 RepID=UPI0033AE0EF6